MAVAIGLALGAGLVSALLFGLVVTGSGAGLFLCYLAPVPVAIVALGWHPLVGLLATAFGGLAISLLLTSSGGLAYAVSAGLPAWALAVLALRVRAGREGEAARTSPGLMLAGTGAAATAVALLSATALGRGSFAAYDATLRALTEAVLRSQFGLPADQALPTIAGLPGASVVEALVDIAPAIAAAVFTVILVLNLWIAGRVVLTSGRLSRPWHALWSARMPRGVLVALGAGALLGLLPGWAGVAGAAATGAATIAFALEGLALLHAGTLGRTGRGGLLGLVYALVALFGGFVLPLLVLAGLLDCATRLRGRLPPPPSPPSTPSV